MTEEVYPINYNDEYHSLRIIPEGMPIYNVKNNVKNLNGRSTWHHWQLIPTSRPVINPAPFKANFISIPGGNGSIDASTVLTNYPTYEDRSGSIEFKSIRDYGSPKGWVRTYELIQNYLHGRRFKVILYDDPLFYYQGRMTVNAWKSDKDWSTITLDYRFDPFKYWVGSDDWNKSHYGDILVIGKGFQTSAYDTYAERTFNHASLSGYELDQYGLPNDVGWTMPVSPEIVITPLQYGNFASYIESAGGKPSTNQSYEYALIGVVPYDENNDSTKKTYTIVGNCGAGGDARLWAFLDDKYNLLTVADASQPVKTGIKAPPRARWMVVNAYVDSNPNISCYNASGEEVIISYTWHTGYSGHEDEGAYIPTGKIVKPSPQNPSCIKFVQYTKNGTTKKAEVSYDFTDENSHSVNAYGILFNNDETKVRIYAEANQKFLVSYNFKRGLL